MIYLVRILLLGLIWIGGCTDDRLSGRKVLNIWIMPNTPDPLRDMERLVKGFELENPGIEVQVTVLDWGSAWTKITTAATAQNGPDIVQLPTTWAASITEMGALLSQDSLFADIGGADQFVSASLESARPWGSDSVTSLPWFLDVRPLFYRKDVLAKIGTKPDEIRTWSDFSKTLRKIRDNKPVVEGALIQPIGYPGKNDWNVIHNFAPWIWGAGGDFLDSSAMRSTLSSPASVQGILFYLDMVREGFNEERNLEKNTAQVSADFDEGRLAFWLDATTKTIYLDRPQFLGGTGKSAAARNYACMMPPSSPTGNAHYFIGGSNLTVFKFSRHVREARKLMQYLVARPDVQLQMARVSGFLPALRETYDMPYFKQDANRRIFMRMVHQAKPYPAVHYWGEIETSILLRRFGNIFDYITESKRGQWPKDRILRELAETDAEVTRYIEQQLKARPGLREKLLERARKSKQGVLWE